MNNNNEKAVLTNRQLKALQTRQLLFKTAIKLFAEKGYYNVSVDEIVERAGTSKGAFYTHFKSKDMVIMEQFKHIDDHYLVTVKELEKYETASRKLSKFVREQLTYTRDELGLEVIKVLYANQLISNDKIKFINDKKRPLFRIVKGIIEDGQKSGEFRDDISADELTRLVARCMWANFFDWCVRNGNFDFVEDGQYFFDIIVIPGLLKRNEGSHAIWKTDY